MWLMRFMRECVVHERMCDLLANMWFIEWKKCMTRRVIVSLYKVTFINAKGNSVFAH